MHQLTSPNGLHSLTVPTHELGRYQAIFQDYTVTEVADAQPDSDMGQDEAAKLGADKAFGQQLIDSFVAASRDNGFDLAQTREINALLNEVEVYLRRGSIAIAREALAEIQPTPLFPAQAKTYYLSLIDTYLTA